MHTKTQESIIEAMYGVFGAYGPVELDQFSPFIDELRVKQGVEIFQTCPLRELSASQLGYFVAKTMTTWGGLQAFKHFLPRLFELAVLKDNSLGLSPLFRKLDYGNWRSWPGEEQQIIEAFIFEYWKQLIFSEAQASSYDCSECLKIVFQARFEVQPFLEAWQTVQSKQQVACLCEFILTHYPELFNKHRFGFHDDANREGHAQTLQKWLCSQDMLEKLSQHFFEFKDSLLAENLSSAVQYLEDWKKWNSN